MHARSFQTVLPSNFRIATLRIAALLGAIVCALASSSAASAAPDLILRVGQDAACGHLGLQSAYDAIPDDPAIRRVEIRIGTSFLLGQRLVIDDLAARPDGFRVEVVGGYANCAALAPTGVTLLRGTSRGPIVEVTAGRARTADDDPFLDRTVVLENLKLTSNDVTLAARRFGAGLFQTTGRAELRDVVFSTLRSEERGGAIYLAVEEGWIPQLDLRGAEFFDTRALSFGVGRTVSGGAIECRGISIFARPRLTGHVESSALTRAEVVDGTAVAAGGFAKLQFCDADLSFGRAGIVNTEAVGNGNSSDTGGAFALVDATLRIRGPLDIRFAKAGAPADGKGGAFHLRRSDLRADSLSSDETSAEHGGFASLSEASTATIGCLDGADCPAGPLPPSVLVRSRALESGGVFHLGAHSDVRAANVIAAEAEAERGAFALLFEASMTLVGSLVVENGGPEFTTASSVFELMAPTTELSLHGVTVAANRVHEAVFVGTALRAATADQVGIHSSILDQANDAILSEPAVEIRSDGCVLTQTRNGLPANAADWRIAAPGTKFFEPSSLEPYRLGESSAARGCTPLFDSGLTSPYDLDGDRFPDPSAGPIDLGADRYRFRSRQCRDVDTLLPAGGATLELPFDPSDLASGLVGDVTVELDGEGSDAAYRVELHHPGRTVLLDDGLVFGDGAFVIYDDERRRAPFSSSVAKLPVEPLRILDGRSADGPWAITLTRVAGDTSAELAFACLELAGLEGPSPFVFADSFESGDVSAWSSH